MMESALTMNGYESVTASHWVEAIDALNERQPDLLLLDLQMPHVDGIFLLEWIREQEMDIPVIVVSGYLDDESVARFNELGVTRLIWKPFNVADLLQEVEACIGPASNVPVTAPPVAEVTLPLSGGAAPLVEATQPRKRHRRRRRSSRLERRKTVKYLVAVAALCILVSSITVVARRVATSLSEIADTGTDKRNSRDTLQELIRAQIKAQVRQEVGKRPAPTKPIELNLKDKK